jgi:hypothetical protein
MVLQTGKVDDVGLARDIFSTDERCDGNFFRRIDIRARRLGFKGIMRSCSLVFLVLN